MRTFRTTLLDVEWHDLSGDDRPGLGGPCPVCVCRVGDETTQFDSVCRMRRARLCSSSVPLQPY